MGIVIYVDVKICNNNIIKDRAACGKKKKTRPGKRNQ